MVVFSFNFLDLFNSKKKSLLSFVFKSVLIDSAIYRVLKTTTNIEIFCTFCTKPQQQQQQKSLIADDNTTTTSPPLPPVVSLYGQLQMKQGDKTNTFDFNDGDSI